MATYTQQEFIDACRALEAYKKLRNTMLDQYCEFSAKYGCQDTDFDRAVFIESLDEAFHGDMMQWQNVEDTYNHEEELKHKEQEGRDDLYL